MEKQQSQNPNHIPEIVKKQPGSGYRHFIRKSDLLRFFDLLPQWYTLSEGLNTIILCSGEPDLDGWYIDGTIGICAWDRDGWRTFAPEYFFEHREILNLLDVSYRKQNNRYLCEFTPPAVRAYQLLHVFLHELGHHRDAMTTRSKVIAARGEGFAEDYSARYFTTIWKAYLQTFGIY